MDVTIGTLVRIYYDEEVYDQGKIKRIGEDAIVVDFCDWIERWTSIEQFAIGSSYFDGDLTFLTPVERGMIVVDFRKSPSGA